jgi:hypothetical protein
VGHLPFVLDLAGSRVARTTAGAARTAKKLVKCILAGAEAVVLTSDDSWTVASAQLLGSKPRARKLDLYPAVEHASPIQP